MTILAVAALGQMLVIMHAGIDLSTPGVMSLGGNLIVGVSLGPGPPAGAGAPRVPRRSAPASGSSTGSSSGSSG